MHFPTTVNLSWLLWDSMALRVYEMEGISYLYIYSFKSYKHPSITFKKELNHIHILLDPPTKRDFYSAESRLDLNCIVVHFKSWIMSIIVKEQDVKGCPHKCHSTTSVPHSTTSAALTRNYARKILYGMQKLSPLLLLLMDVGGRQKI